MDTIIQIAQPVLYAVSLCLTIFFSIKGFRLANKQALEQSKQMFFAEYTKRYQDIIMAMPAEVFSGEARMDNTTLKYMQLYFDLCSEEYHLHKQGVIPDDVWNNWKEGMELIMKVKLYKTCWTHRSGLYNSDFADFFDREVIKS